MVDAFAEETAWCEANGYRYRLSKTHGFIFGNVNHALHFKLRFAG